MLRAGAQEQQTKASGWGKKPVWGDTFDFDISNEKELSIQVMDKEAMGKDKPIGKTTVSIMQWIAKGTFDGELEIQDSKGKPAGSVQLSVKFTKPGAGMARHHLQATTWPNERWMRRRKNAPLTRPPAIPTVSLLTKRSKRLLMGLITITTLLVRQSWGMCWLISVNK